MLVLYRIGDPRKRVLCTWCGNTLREVDPADDKAMAAATDSADPEFCDTSHQSQYNAMRLASGQAAARAARG